jgi:sucrose-6-phosphate hydrolase SacC (GH32 family)
VDRTHSGLTRFSSDFPARTAAPLATDKALVRFRILVDRSAVELFVQDGRATFTNLVYPPANTQAIEFYSRNGSSGKVTFDVWRLQSTWGRTN